MRYNHHNTSLKDATILSPMPSPRYPQPWTTRQTQTHFQNRWLRVDIDTVELPDGRLYDYTIIREKKHGVAVIAVDTSGNILLQQEYRHPVEQIIWQVPGGLIDEGETPLAAARRELLEETGHAAPHWRYLGTFWDNPALEDMQIHLYLAWPAALVNDGNRDDTEWLCWQWQSWSWLKQSIRKGEIKERVILAALGLLWAHGELTPQGWTPPPPQSEG